MIKGKIGKNLNLQDGQKASRYCVINIIAQAKKAMNGDLDKIKNCVKITGYVNSTDDFYDQPKVINPASETLSALFDDKGKHTRDFTYIDDIVLGTRKAIDKNYKCEIFNLGNHRSEKLMDMIEMIEVELNKKAIIDFQPLQPGDAKESFADIEYTKKLLSWEPTVNIKVGIPQFIKWYKGYFD